MEYDAIESLTEEELAEYYMDIGEWAEHKAYCNCYCHVYYCAAQRETNRYFGFFQGNHDTTACNTGLINYITSACGEYPWWMIYDNGYHGWCR